MGDRRKTSEGAKCHIGELISEPSRIRRGELQVYRLRHPRERGYSRRGHDTAVPTVARYIPRSGTEASIRLVQDSAGQQNDLTRRDRGNGGLPAFCPGSAHNRPACVRGWRLRAP